MQIQQMDSLQMEVDEAKVTIEKLHLKDRELRKSLDKVMEERKVGEKEKLEAISSYEIVLTVRLERMIVVATKGVVSY